jgi:tripartite-type tricarboxylate transporter receptor subunit TctC
LLVTRILGLVANVRILAFLFACFALEAFGQSYPSKPIRLIIPFPPGGSSDVVGRELAHHLGRALGTHLVIDNRGGANGLLGTKALAVAAPDGYTLGFHILTSHITNPFVYRNVPYDVMRDFSSITLVGWSGLVFVANPAFPAKTMQDLIDLSRATPGGINIGSFGTASLAHLSIELLKSMADVNVTHVPYNGSGPAVAATLAGQVPVSVVGLPAALPSIKTDRLRPLAITGAKRSPQLPDVPTVAEAPELPHFDAGLMYGLLAPANTPTAIIRQVQQATVEVLKSPDVQHRLHQRGLDSIIGSTPEEMDAYLKSETAKIRTLLVGAGITSQ